MTNTPKAPVEISREELYERVWQTPMQRLAAEYGISGNGLAKICDRLSVPYPPRGYWARIAAGQKVAKYRLLEPGSGTPRKVTISPTSPKAPVEINAEAATQIEKIKTEITVVTVPERLTRPHQIVERWISDHAQRKRDSLKERDPLLRRLSDPGELAELDHRRHRLLDAFFKAIEKLGGRIRTDDRQAPYAEMNGERIDFQLREKQKQTRRPLTSDEKRWTSKDDKGWRQQLQPTGRLNLSIKTYLPTLPQKEWQDSDTSPLEERLSEIVATFVAAGPMLVEQRLKREAQERERQIAGMKRYEAERAAKLEVNRWRHFVELARAHEDVAVARSFLQAIKQSAFDPTQQAGGRSLADWVAWVQDHLAASDPINRGALDLFTHISKITEWTYRTDPLGQRYY